MNPILEADSIRLSYGTRQILTDIYLKCTVGETVGLLGRNGTGKSSLLQILFGSKHTEDKSIRFNHLSKPTAFLEPALVNYLPQFNFLPASFTLQKFFKQYDISFGDFILEFPEFQHLEKTTMRNISGGERRLIEVYCIVVKQSKFALLDEPFSQLSPIHIEKIIKIISQKKSSKGFLITDQLYKEIISISDQLYLLVNGKTHAIKEVAGLQNLGYANEAQLDGLNKK